MKRISIFCITLLLLAAMTSCVYAFTCTCQGTEEYDWKGDKTRTHDCGSGFAGGTRGQVVNVGAGDLYHYLDAYSMGMLTNNNAQKVYCGTSGWECSR